MLCRCQHFNSCQQMLHQKLGGAWFDEGTFFCPVTVEFTTVFCGTILLCVIKLTAFRLVLISLGWCVGNLADSSNEAGIGMPLKLI